MRIIKEVSKRIKEELHDAEWYAEEALEHKAMYPDVAEVYHHLAKEELSHALGRLCAVLSVEDEGFAERLREMID